MQLKKKEIFAMYREGVITQQIYQKWFVKFCAGNFSLDNVSQLGRPVEIDQHINWTQSMLHHMGNNQYTQKYPT